MVHTDIIQYLSEIDTMFPIFQWYPLSLLGLFHDFLYRKNNLGTDVRHHPIHITKELPLESRSVYVAAMHLSSPFADQMCSSIIRPVVARLRPPIRKVPL